MHGVTGFAESAALSVCAAFALVTICSRIGVPSIVGYILAGIVIGPAGLDLIAENAALSIIGEIGVVLLLFALGLEFSFEKLVRLRKHVFGLGAVQVAVTVVSRMWWKLPNSGLRACNVGSSQAARSRDIGTRG